MREIITDETKLAERALEIDTRTQNKEMREIISELKTAIKKNNISALSAPAIGYNRRIFCLNISDLEIKTFINPLITLSEGLTVSKETCTSIPGKTYLIPRNSKIEFMYQDPLGRTQCRRVTGAAACAIQHEIAHLDGLLISDIGLEIDEQYDNASEEEQEELIRAYLESLDLTAKQLEKDIEDDSELKQLSDGIDFMTKAHTGEVDIESFPD